PRRGELRREQRADNRWPYPPRGAAGSLHRQGHRHTDHQPFEQELSMVLADKVSRREQILQALARMLENKPGGRITTAALAEEVGVSEAALYRHFPSKARMFEGLIGFIEDTLFTRITRIIQDESQAAAQCEKILLLVLTFAERNPGITRILNGDALAG